VGRIARCWAAKDNLEALSKACANTSKPSHPQNTLRRLAQDGPASGNAVKENIHAEIPTAKRTIRAVADDRRIKRLEVSSTPSLHHFDATRARLDHPSYKVLNFLEFRNDQPAANEQLGGTRTVNSALLQVKPAEHPLANRLRSHGHRAEG